MSEDCLHIKGSVIRRILNDHFSKRETTWDMNSMKIALDFGKDEKYYLSDGELSLEFTRKVSSRFKS